MSFLKKLFGDKEQQQPAAQPTDNIVEQPAPAAQLPAEPTAAQPVSAPSTEPDNTKLIDLLDAFGENRNENTYKAVMDEIMTGNTFLLLTTAADPADIKAGRRTVNPGERLEFNCVFNNDGLTALVAFTDEAALLEWTKQPAPYIALPMAHVMEFAQQNNIDRIVINNDQPDMFVMERDRSHISTNTVNEPTQIMIGAPANPMSPVILDKMKEGFQRIEAVEEAYHFLKQQGEEQSYAVGLRVSDLSENAQIALQNAIGNAMQNQQTDFPLDVMVLDDDLYNGVKNIPGSLFYKK